MTVRDIVLYAHNPAPLRKKCKAVKGVNRHTRRLIRDLQDTLSAHVMALVWPPHRLMYIVESLSFAWAVDMTMSVNQIHLLPS